MEHIQPIMVGGSEGQVHSELVAEVPTIANGGISEDGKNGASSCARRHLARRHGVHRRRREVHHGTLNNPHFRAYSRNGHSLVNDIKVVSPTEMTWRMKQAYRAVSIDPVVDLHRAGAHPGQSKDPSTSSFNNAPVGTGPFNWSERVPGDHITLVANRQYYGRVHIWRGSCSSYVPDLTALFTQFQTGAIDHTGLQGITADHYDRGEQDPRPHVVTARPSRILRKLHDELGNPVFKELSVRQALYTRWTRRPSSTTIYYGLPKPTDTYLPTQSWAYNPDLPKQRYDPEKAKQILDDAGWKPGAGGVPKRTACDLRSPTPRPPAITCASRRRNCCSKPGARSVPTCRSRTCRRR